MSKKDEVIVDLTVDLKTGEVTATDWAGHTTKHKPGETILAGIITAKKQLQWYLDNGHEVPGLTRRNIHAYDCILNAPNPELAARQYADLRANSDYEKTHVDCVKELGLWNEPKEDR